MVSHVQNGTRNVVGCLPLSFIKIKEECLCCSLNYFFVGLCDSVGECSSLDCNIDRRSGCLSISFNCHHILRPLILQLISLVACCMPSFCLSSALLLCFALLVV